MIDSYLLCSLFFSPYIDVSLLKEYVLVEKDMHRR